MLFISGYYEGYNNNACNLSVTCKSYKQAKKIMKAHYDKGICNKFKVSKL